MSIINLEADISLMPLDRCDDHKVDSRATECLTSFLRARKAYRTEFGCINTNCFFFRAYLAVTVLVS
jgi:hypothetical protein